MKNLYYRPTPSFKSKHKPVGRSASGGGSNPKFGKYLVIALCVYFIFNFLTSGSPNSEVVDTSNSFFLSKIDGNIRVLDEDNNPLENVLAPFEVEPGYSILTAVDSSAILNYTQDLKIRLAPSTKLEFLSYDDILTFALDSGQVWVSNNFSPIDSPKISIESNYLKIDSNASSYNLKSSLPEAVSVLSGNMLVSIKDDSTGSVLDQIKLDLGKQLTLDNESYQKFKNRQVASVISTLQSDLIQSPWYKWNVALDSNNMYEPFSGFTRDFIASNLVDTSLDEEDLEDESSSDSVEEIDPAIQPIVTYPNADEVQTEEIIIMEGTVPPDTQKVMIVSYDEGEAVPYILKEFKPELGKFKYYASYDPGRGNVVIGKNKFDIIAIFSDGTESPKTTFEFEFAKELPKPVAVNSDPAVEPAVEQPSVDPTAITSSELIASADDISIDTMNGLSFENNFVLTSDRGFLQGSVGTNVVAVYVNNFKLTRFKPNSGSFHYIMSPSFNTLSVGDNKVSVYGVYADGSKTAVMNLNIVYRP